MRYENSPVAAELIKKEVEKLLVEIVVILDDPGLPLRKPTDSASLYLEYFLPRLQNMIKFDRQAECKEKIAYLCAISLNFIREITALDDWENKANFMTFFENALLPYDLGRYEKIILRMAQSILD